MYIPSHDIIGYRTCAYAGGRIGLHALEVAHETSSCCCRHGGIWLLVWWGSCIEVWYPRAVLGDFTVGVLGAGVGGVGRWWWRDAAMAMVCVAEVVLVWGSAERLPGVPK